MKLIDLFEVTFDSEKKKSAALQKLRDVKSQIKTLRSKASSGHSSGIAPQYQQQWDRLQLAKKLAQDEYDSVDTKAQAHATSHNFHQAHATKRANEVPEEKKDRFGDAVSAGLTHTNDLRSNVGGHAGVAEKMLAYAKLASKDGSVKVTAEDLAHQFDTTARTVNRWLNRPEFHQVALLLGRGVSR
jgi:hypothetical protein